MNLLNLTILSVSYLYSQNNFKDYIYDNYLQKKKIEICCYYIVNNIELDNKHYCKIDTQGNNIFFLV